MGKREVTEGTVRVMIDGEMFTTGIVEFSKPAKVMATCMHEWEFFSYHNRNDLESKREVGTFVWSVLGKMCHVFVFKCKKCGEYKAVDGRAMAELL